MSEPNGPGQPTKYRPEYCEQLIEHFDVEPYREIQKKIVTKQGDVVEIPENEANDFPTLASFAIKIGVHRDTLHEWSKVHEEFGEVYRRAKDYQENYLVTNGLKGLVNPLFGIFTAKNVLGWRDRQPGEIDTVVNNNNSATSNVQTLSDDALDAKIKDQMSKLYGKNES